MTLDSAWRAIDRGLEQAINRRERVILLITGIIERVSRRWSAGGSARRSMTGLPLRGMRPASPPFEERIDAMAAAAAFTSF